MENHAKLNGWGRIAVAAVISILATSGFWNLLYGDRPTREQVQEMIDRDNGALIKAIDELKSEQRELRKRVEEALLLARGQR